jgi:uncharacterized membrane protein YfcA
MKEKTIVSAATLLASLAGYFYAKHSNKDAVPYVMIGGFIGAVIGEAIVLNTKNKDKPDGNNQ